MVGTTCAGVDCDQGAELVPERGVVQPGWWSIAGDWWCPGCVDRYWTPKAGAHVLWDEPLSMEERDRLRAFGRAKPRPRADAPPEEIRAYNHAWGQLMDPRSTRTLTLARPEMFEIDADGLVWLRVQCRSCRVHGRLPLDAPGVAPEHRNKLSVIAVMCAQLWCCERCGEKEEAAVAVATASRVVSLRLKESGMPSALAAEVTWATMLEKGSSVEDTHRRIRAIDACKRWAEKERPENALLLYGDPGTGKTRLAATAAKARMAHSPIAWVSVAVLMAQLDAAWSDDDRHSALKTLTGKGPVVLDDLDKANMTPRVLGHLFTALDKRDQSKQRAVIFTTNKKPSELAGMLGDVLMSRIAGMCGATGMMPFPGPDRRLEIGEE